MIGYNPWKAHVENDVLRQETFLVVTKEERDGTRYSLMPPVAVEIKPTNPITPTWTGSHDDTKALMQALLDTAWNMGLRPKDYEGPQELKAVNRHLEDMRRIAFSALASSGTP